MITWLFGPRGRQSRSMENPAVPLSDPEPWLFEAWGGGKSAAGVRVGPATALSYSPVWRAVSLIGRDIGKLPLDVYRREGEGKTRDREHPAYQLLRRKPNEYMTALPFRLCLQARALLVGNGYAYIKRNGVGEPVALYPLCSFSWQPAVDVGGVLWYVNDGEGRKLEARNVLHIKGLGDGIRGESVISYARNTLGLGIAAERFGGGFFKNGLRPSATLEHPGTLKPEAKQDLINTIEKYHIGLEDKHRLLVLQQGMKIHPFSTTNEEAQFLETLQQNVRMVANWFGVPPHKLGDITRTAFASLEQENQSYLNDAIDPWAVTWEEQCWDKVLSDEEKEKDSHFVEFNRNALQRADSANRSTFYHNALQDGWMNRDEVRSRENLNPIPDGEGQEYYVPKNMGTTGDPTPAPAGTAPAEEDPPPEETPKKKGKKKKPADDQGEAYARELEQSHRRLLVEVLERMVRRVATQAKRSAGRPEEYARFLEGLAAAHGPVFREACLPAVGAVRAAILLRRSRFVDPAEKFLEDLAEAFFVGVSLRLKLSDCSSAAAEKACERAEREIPGALAESLLKGEL